MDDTAHTLVSQLLMCRSSRTFTKEKHLLAVAVCCSSSKTYSLRAAVFPLSPNPLGSSLKRICRKKTPFSEKKHRVGDVWFKVTLALTAHRGLLVAKIHYDCRRSPDMIPRRIWGSDPSPRLWIEIKVLVSASNSPTLTFIAILCHSCWQKFSHFVLCVCVCVRVCVYFHFSH